MEGSPAMRPGLLPGSDQILKVDGQPTERMDLNEAIDELRGEAGEKITMTILRPSTREVKDYPMIQEIIKVASVKDAWLLSPENRR